MRERTNAAEQEVCQRGIGIISGEAVGAVLEKVIVMIEAGALVRASNREIVTALDQPDSVVPVKRGARENRIGERTETEKARDAERFDRLVRRLINVLDAEVAHVGRVRRRVAAGALARHAEAEIVEQPRAENVGFLKQPVLREYFRAVRVSKNVGPAIGSGIIELVAEVTSGEAGNPDVGAAVAELGHALLQVPDKIRPGPSPRRKSRIRL